MGLCCSSNLSAEEQRELENSKRLDRKNKQEAAAEAAKIKLLLLGTGESGKSTIFKQMKILYGDHHGFTQEERESFRVTIHGNIISNLKTVLDHTERFDDESLKEKVDGFMDLPEGKDAKIDTQIGDLIGAFWNDAGVQETWAIRNTFQVQDALQYYCSKIEEIKSPSYIPTPNDILFSRVRTSGIIEETYIIDGVTFVMFDVGGQRNERKKWIHCFDDVTAVIFVAAINEFNQKLYEDATVNRLDEAIILFDEIANSVYFKDTSIILFLNKNDLFRDKICHVPLRVDEGPEQRHLDFKGPFVDFNGKSSQIGTPEYEACYSAAKDYILALFLARAKKRKSTRQVFSHVTEATNTKNIQTIWASCKSVILQENLVSSGFSLD